MREIELLGAVVVSKAGRDKKRAFFVIGEESPEYVLLADGSLRKLERPKKKKRKHIRLESCRDERIRQKILEGQTISNAEIRNSLIDLGYQVEQ